MILCLYYVCLSVVFVFSLFPGKRMCFNFSMTPISRGFSFESQILRSDS